MKTNVLKLALFSCATLGLLAFVPMQKESHAEKSEAVASSETHHQHHQHHHHHKGHQHSTDANCYLGCGGEGAFTHSCNLVTPLGFYDVFAKAPLTVIAIAQEAVQVEGEIFESKLAIQETLIGESSNTIRVQFSHSHRDEVIPAGERVLLALQGDAESGYHLSTFESSVVLIDRPELAGAEAYVKSCINDQESIIQPLLTAILEGGQVTRYRAALDYELRHEVAMPNQGFEAVAELLGTVQGWDPAIPSLMEIVATSKNPNLAHSLISLIESPVGMKVFEEVDRLSDLEGVVDGVLDSLEVFLSEDKDPGVRRLAAYVLARSDAEGAKERLIELLEDADQDIASEAIIGLAGSEDPKLRSNIRDQVAKRLAQHEIVKNETPLGRVIRNRQLAHARHGWHSGDDFRFMAAIYFVARSPDAKERNWLLGRLGRIEDFGIRTFAEAKLRGAWQSYDSPW